MRKKKEKSCNPYDILLIELCYTLHQQMGFDRHIMDDLSC